MIVGLDRPGLIETAERHLHAIAEDLFVHAERAAGGGAETAFRSRRGTISRGLSRRPNEAGDGEMNEGQESGARHLAAGAAMAIDDAHRRRLGAVAHGTAQTSARPRHERLRVISEPINLALRSGIDTANRTVVHPPPCGRRGVVAKTAQPPRDAGEAEDHHRPGDSSGTDDAKTAISSKPRPFGSAGIRVMRNAVR